MNRLLRQVERLLTENIISEIFDSEKLGEVPSICLHKSNKMLYHRHGLFNFLTLPCACPSPFSTVPNRLLGHRIYATRALINASGICTSQLEQDQGSRYRDCHGRE